MGLCLAGHHLILSEGENPKRLGLKRPFALLCPRSPGLAPWSHRSYLLMDSLVSRYGGPSLGPRPLGRCQKIGEGRRYCTHISSIRVCMLFEPLALDLGGDRREEVGDRDRKGLLVRRP